MRIFHHNLVQVFARHDAIDQAEIAVPSRRRWVRRSAAFPWPACARHCATSATIGRRAKQADIDSRRAERCFVGCDGEIAACNQLAAGCSRQAIHFGDHRLWMAARSTASARSRRHGLLEKGPAPVGVGAMRRHFLEIVPGAKHLAVTRQARSTRTVMSSRARPNSACSAAIIAHESAIGRRTGQR